MVFENDKMIVTKEFQTVEFKQLRKDEYLKTICAFANSNGGILYIGVSDDGKENFGVRYWQM